MRRNDRSHSPKYAVALQHGMNANLLHRWRKEWAQGLHRLEGGITTAVATPQTPAFVPIELSAAASITASEQSSVAASTPATDIRIECQRPGMSVSVHWPLSAADQCAQMLRELLR